MLATVLYGPRDIRLESRETPRIVEPTDAVIRISATCVWGRTCGRIADCSGSTAHCP